MNNIIFSLSDPVSKIATARWHCHNIAVHHKPTMLFHRAFRNLNRFKSTLASDSGESGMGFILYIDIDIDLSPVDTNMHFPSNIAFTLAFAAGAVLTTFGTYMLADFLSNFIQHPSQLVSPRCQ